MSRSSEKRLQRAMEYFSQGRLAPARAHLKVLQESAAGDAHTLLLARKSPGIKTAFGTRRPLRWTYRITEL
jgi:Tfp pilus assembly protein PilF